MLRELAGEWPCVPFGTPGQRPELPAPWHANSQTENWDNVAHGFASHNRWHLEQVNAKEIVAHINYPQDHPIDFLVRKIRLDSQCLKVHFSLEIQARYPSRLPIGLHPVFNLADCQNERCRLRTGGSNEVWTLPSELEPTSIFTPDQRAADMAALALRNGEKIDARFVPFPTRSEDLLMLTNPDGMVCLDFLDQGYSIRVNWDVNKLPSCVLWYSMGGREYYPWNGRVRAIGIEPVAAAFDLGVAYARSDSSPLTKAGVANGVDLQPDQTWSINYSISLEQGKT